MFTNFLWTLIWRPAFNVIFLYKNVIRYYVEAVKAFFILLFVKLKKMTAFLKDGHGWSRVNIVHSRQQ